MAEFCDQSDETSGSITTWNSRKVLYNAVSLLQFMNHYNWTYEIIFNGSW
jgi:hypothetical protein